MYHLISVLNTKTVIDTSIPVTDGYNTAWRFFYRFDLTNQLCAGDLLEVHAEHEITNNTGANTELVTAIALCNNGQWYDTDLFDLGLHSVPTNGVFLAGPAGGNVDPQEHHRLITRSGFAVVPDASFEPYSSIIYKVRARRDVPSGSITIEPYGYGQMTLKQWRPC